MKIATHNGSFHADDVFAFAILRVASSQVVDWVRSRDQAVLETADVVFDVGGTFDPARGRYDHHMRARPMRPSGEPFSSAGLIWRDYGLRAVPRLFPNVSPEVVERVVAMVDAGLIRDVDLMDNGAMTATPGHFSTVIEAFNPTFAEAGDEDEAFLRAADVALIVLRRVCAQAVAAVDAEASVAAAADAALDPRIIVLDRRIPWEDAIFDLGLSNALYVIRPAGNQWTCSAVPPERGSFDQRRPLPEPWAGLRDGAFVDQTGVADASFCHPARFICGATSKAGILALAKLAVA